MDQYTRSDTSCFRCFSIQLILAKHPVAAKYYNLEAIQFDMCRMDHGLCPGDRECASPPSGSNNSPVCFDTHIAFPSSRLSISCHIPFPHINGFHLNTFFSQQLHLMYVCQPAWTDLLSLILSLAIGLRTRRSDHHPGLRCCLSVCNHRNEQDGRSLRIGCLSICSIGRVSSCPLYTCLIVRQIMRIRRSNSSTWYQLRGLPRHEPRVAG